MKPDTENTGGLKSAVVKFMTIKVTKLTLLHKISKTGMIHFAKPVLIEELHTAQKEEFSKICYMCDMYT
jgi:hypothetical protein